MNLTELQILRQKIAGMTDSEFENWLGGQIIPHVNEAYQAGRKYGYSMAILGYSLEDEYD